MSQNGKFAKPNPGGKPNSKLVIGLSCAAVVLIVLIVLLLVLRPQEQPPVETTEPIETTTMPTETETTPTTVPETTVPEETEPQMLDWMVEYYEQNPDIAGWIKIDGTKLDNPVMYVAGDNQKYMRRNFKGFFSVAGLPFVDGSCSMDPESDNLIIYAHNMNDGTMFRTIMNYSEQKYWEEHPIIQFSTLYEERTYEVVAAFYDRVYYSYENVFKFYQFVDAENEAHFNEAITYFKDHSEYDTGVLPEYGDNLITLVTCSYHTEYGRFVVVARQIVEEPEADSVE